MLCKYFKTELARIVEEKSAGIFIIKGEMFSIQVVVGRKLPEKENIWLKNLNKGKMDMQTLKKMRVLKKGIGQDINTEAYFNVLFTAKANLLEEVELMGRSSLAELIEDMGFPQEWENRGIEKGIDEGIEITLTIIKKLMDNIPPHEIAEELKLPQEKIMAVKSYLEKIIIFNPQE